ncbi:MAG TPA: hypothetical protein VK517_16830 [Cyclobacteriaceae bacterium]|nr:hypothetical protein [Cyclobacteriaceae bacterium]
MESIYAVPVMSSILRKSARSDYAKASSDRSAGNNAAIPRDLRETMLRFCMNLRDPTALKLRRTGLRETMLRFCVNLRDPRETMPRFCMNLLDPTTPRLRRTGLRETMPRFLVNLRDLREILS